MYPHPCDVSRPLFFLFDSVHILKCVRNNWVNQKSTGKCMMYPSVKSEKVQVDNCSINRFELIKPVIIAQATFNSLERLHQLECDSIVRFAYKLSLKALNPSPFERQNVNLAVRIFPISSLKPWSNLAAGTTFCIGTVPAFTLKLFPPS